ncbi:NBR1-Ig-like domain-containing protein [Candidatus Leptofilum sp.]|uniref:NBR1-Ig-like domain-containing protein n=1 Tax=Candidatus Leptofilum sp. TaxID=3241576 RepID=UPI003B5B242F
MKSNQPQASLLSMETFANLDQLVPGEPFSVTWVLVNSGESAWEDVALAFANEATPADTELPYTNLAQESRFSLEALGAGKTLTPGETAYLTLAFTAPGEPGAYFTGWQLQTAVGEPFGPICELLTIVVPGEAKALTEFDYQLIEFSNSVPNYNAMEPGTAFTGSWLLKNTGMNSWSGDFQLVASAELQADTRDARFSQMGAPHMASLRDLSGLDSVPPDGTVTLRLAFKAPASPGVYAYHWQLHDSAGRPFGGKRWLRIVVKGTSQPQPTPAPTPTTPSDAYVYGGTAVKFFTGIHGPADDWMWNDGAFQKMMTKLAMSVFFWSQGANGDHAHFGDKTKNAVRLYWNPRAVSADEAYREVANDQLRNWWNKGYRRFVFFNEPQFGKEIAKIEEGMGISWHNKEQFASFLARCLQLAKQEFPGIQLFTTPMSSNAAFDPWGWRTAMWAAVKSHVDGWCMHAYSGDNANADAAAQNIADQVIALQRRFQLQIPIIISEASVNRGNDAAQKARVAHLLHQKLSQVPGVEGVFWYAADWNPDFDTHHEGWFRNGIADAYLQQRNS